MGSKIHSKLEAFKEMYIYLVGNFDEASKKMARNCKDPVKAPDRNVVEAWVQLWRQNLP